MSIATELDALNDNILDAYTAISTKGGTVPAQKNTANLDTAIASITSGGGGTPSTPTITSATYANSAITITGTNFDSNSQVKLFNRAYDRWDTITPTSSTSTTFVIPVGGADYGYYSRVVKVVNAGLESNVKFLYEKFVRNLLPKYVCIFWIYTSGTNPLPLTPCLCQAPSTSQNINATSVVSTPRSNNYSGYNLNTSGWDSITIPSNAIRGVEIHPLATDFGTYNTHPVGLCRALDQPLGLANLTSLGTSDFMAGAISFNSPVDLNTLDNLGNGFLKFCMSFNQPLDLSNVKTIGGTFLSSCYAYNQPLSFVGDTDTTMSIGDNFMKDCTGFTGNLYFENCSIVGVNSFNNMTALSSITVKNTTISTDSTALAMTQYMQNSPAYVNGIVVNGDSSATTILANLPNTTATPWRKLVQGTITS